MSDQVQIVDSAATVKDELLNTDTGPYLPYLQNIYNRLTSKQFECIQRTFKARDPLDTQKYGVRAEQAKLTCVNTSERGDQKTLNFVVAVAYCCMLLGR
jgi:hypothetical protein